MIKLFLVGVFIFILFIYFKSTMMFKSLGLNMNFYNLFMILMFCLIILLYLVSYKLNNFFYMNLYHNFIGYDYLSYTLILLTLWIFLMVFMSFYGNEYSLNLFILMIFLLFILISSFLMLNMFMFYVFFEMSLIPMSFIIMAWGGGEFRVSSMFYMLLYTLIGSMPLLILMFLFYEDNQSMSFLILQWFYLKIDFSLVNYLMCIMAFLVKMPMYLVHMWLPKAHVEAPVYGSMILAGILLKLGSYGLYRVLMLLKILNLEYNYLILSITLVGMLNISLNCLMQIDLKMLVAYSSVVHMGLLLMGLLVMMKVGYESSIMMNISHGLCSSGLFYLVNVIYFRSWSRMIFFNKGLMLTMSSMTLLWFMMCSSNLSAPLSLNLVSEVMLFSSVIMWNKLIFFYLMLICFFSFSYSVYLFSVTQYGKMNSLSLVFNSGKSVEYLVLLLHWIPLNILMLNFNIFL